MNPRSRKTRLLGLLPSSLVVTRLPARGKIVHLTFDDGPDPEHTAPVLDLLARHGAKATFFLVGNRLDDHPGVVERIVREGHQLGNHSWTHPFMSDLPLAGQLEEIERTDRALARFDGIERHPFRPPCGVLPANLLLHYARHRRTIAYWSYDSHDYTKLPADRLAANLEQHPPRPGEVVLMHDDNAETSALLARMLPAWIAAGWQVQALPPLRA